MTLNAADPYQGLHLLADLHGCSHLDDATLIEQALRRSAEVAGATVLDIRLHLFGPGQGVTGVALLAESHISIHSWPEHGYAAVDFFLCGVRHDAEAGFLTLCSAFNPTRIERQVIRRGYAVLPNSEKSSTSL